jgi:hypothetical protein
MDHDFGKRHHVCHRRGLRDLMDRVGGLGGYVRDDRIAAARLAALGEMLMLPPPALMRREMRREPVRDNKISD